MIAHESPPPSNNLMEQGQGNSSLLMSNNRKDRWLTVYEELNEYKAKHGHCNVSTKLGSLRGWVGTQRREYRKLVGGERSVMTDERLRKLEAIGFEWELNRRPCQWETRFGELKIYRENHGHCNAARKNSLGRWVHKQRGQYRLLKQGKPSCMTDDRIRMLDTIGFRWDIGTTLKGGDDPWHARFQELQNYKAEFGTLHVPQRSGQLGAWISNQRSYYKSACLSDERIRELESVGFQWSAALQLESGEAHFISYRN